jgi:hypothetical protein
MLSSKSCVLKYKQDAVLDENRIMDNVQKHNICTNVPSPETFRSYQLKCIVKLKLPWIERTVMSWYLHYDSWNIIFRTIFFPEIFYVKHQCYFIWVLILPVKQKHPKTSIKHYLTLLEWSLKWVTPNNSSDQVKDGLLIVVAVCLILRYSNFHSEISHKLNRFFLNVKYVCK